MSIVMLVLGLILRFAAPEKVGEFSLHTTGNCQSDHVPSLLANPEVLELAFKPHHIEDQLDSIVFTEPLKSGEWQRLEDEQRKVRFDLFNACRRNLGLRETLPIVPERYIGPTGSGQGAS